MAGPLDACPVFPENNDQGKSRSPSLGEGGGRYAKQLVTGLYLSGLVGYSSGKRPAVRQPRHPIHPPRHPVPRRKRSWHFPSLSQTGHGGNPPPRDGVDLRLKISLLGSVTSDHLIACIGKKNIPIVAFF
jgi:hypothetical protein